MELTPSEIAAELIGVARIATKDPREQAEMVDLVLRGRVTRRALTQEQSAEISRAAWFKAFDGVSP